MKESVIKKRIKPEKQETSRKEKVIIKLEGGEIVRFKNVREKIKFIDSLEHENNQSIVNLFSILSLLSKDKNTDVKETLAKQLANFDVDEIEYILYEMLSDKNRMVRLEALDSVSIGRHDATIDKVGNMLEGEGYLIRMYAVLALFDLITNAYGLNEKAYDKYKGIIDKSFQIEKNARVLSAYYQNEYYINQEVGLSLLKTLYFDALETEEYNLIWTVLHIFKEIKNRSNYKDIQKIMEYKEEKLLPIQKAFVDNMQRENVPYKILILDEDNTFLSHVIGLLLASKCNKEDLVISTAGICSGGICLNDIRLFCERNNILCPDELYSRRITEAYTYDFIVSLNTTLNPEMYSKIKILNYENIKIGDDGQLISVCEDIKVQLLDEKVSGIS